MPWSSLEIGLEMEDGKPQAAEARSSLVVSDGVALVRMNLE
jgi:hypothetical protein